MTKGAARVPRVGASQIHCQYCGWEIDGHTAKQAAFCEKKIAEGCHLSSFGLYMDGTVRSGK